MSEELAAWLSKEVQDRGWTLRGLARRAAVSHSAVANAANGLGTPSVKVLRGLARATGTPIEDLYRMAGILPRSSRASESRPGYDIDENDETRLVRLYRELSDDDQDMIIDLVERLTGRTAARIVGRAPDENE